MSAGVKPLKAHKVRVSQSQSANTPRRASVAEGANTTRRASQRCWGCSGLIPSGPAVVCGLCLSAPPVWMIASARFVAEELGVAA